MPKPLRFIVYPAFAFFCLAFFTLVLFPFNSVKHRLAAELEEALGGDYIITIGHLSPSPLSGVVLEDVEIRPRGDTDSVPVKFSRAKMKIALFALLSGTVEIDFDLRAGEGRSHGSFVWKKGGIGIDLQLQKFDLALAGFVAQKAGIPLSGLVNGMVQAEIYSQDPLRNTGKIVLEIPDLRLGEINVGGGALQLPALQLAQDVGGAGISKIDIEIDRGNLEVKQIQFVGGNLELQADGKVYGARRLDNYRFNLKGSMKVAPDVAEKVPLLLAVEKQKSADGTYPFTITGRIAKPSIRIGDFKLPI
jgi:type II secretion system protein N